jgi:hypothetical protein
LGFSSTSFRALRANNPFADFAGLRLVAIGPG